MSDEIEAVEDLYEARAVIMRQHNELNRFKTALRNALHDLNLYKIGCKDIAEKLLADQDEATEQEYLASADDEIADNHDWEVKRAKARA